MSPIEIQVARVRRGAWLVVLIVAVAVAGAAFSAWHTGTQYSGRAALSIGSPNRAPEQDSVLAQGYVDYFNDEANQQRLLEQAQLQEGVTYSAQLAASSPIIYIDGVGPDSGAVQAGVSGIARALQQDVNDALAKDLEARIGVLRQQMAVHQAEVDGSAGNSQRGTLAAQAVTELQTSINEMQADNSNELQLLQGAAAVAESRPNLPLNLGLAALGGLILGVLAALALAAVRNRMVTGPEVHEKLGIEVLADLAVGDDGEERDRRLKRLANLVGNRADPRGRAPIVAVVAPRATTASEWVARVIAGHRAAQGADMVLVGTDINRPPADLRDLLGVADLLADDAGGQLATVLQPGRPQPLRVIAPGSPGRDPYEQLGTQAVRRLLERVAKQSSGVIVAVPPLLDAPEAQAICATVDDIILVIEANGTPVEDGRQAIQLLAQVNHAPLGAVLVGQDIPELPSVLARQAVQTAAGPGSNGPVTPRVAVLQPAVRRPNAGPGYAKGRPTGNGGTSRIPPSIPTMPVQQARPGAPMEPPLRPRPRPEPIIIATDDPPAADQPRASGS